MKQSKKESKCLHCGQPTTEIVKLTETEEGNTRRTLTTIEVCTNPRCWSHINLEKVKSWEIK